MENGPKYSGEELFARILAWCDRQERSSKQVMERLGRWGVAESESGKIYKRLVSMHAVDDERFASAYTSDAMRFKNWGRRKIELGLHRAGITPAIAQKAFDELDRKEYRDKIEHLIHIALKKGHSVNDYASRMKLANHIARKGFEAEEIFAALDKIRDDRS